MPASLMGGGKRKKTDVVKHPEVFDHVGLLVNKPPGTSRVALHLVFRRLRFKTEIGANLRQAVFTPRSFYALALGKRGKSHLCFAIVKNVQESPITRNKHPREKSGRTLFRGCLPPCSPNGYPPRRLQK
jgi:hypothetical protein